MNDINLGKEATSEQLQSKPVAWGAWRKSLNRFHYIHDDRLYMEQTYGEGSESSQDFDLMPLFTHADTGEVERLRADIALRDRELEIAAEAHGEIQEERDILRAQVIEANCEIEKLRAKLAEWDALLRDTKAMLASELSYELFAKMASHIKRINAALSASAELSAQPTEI